MTRVPVLFALATALGVAAVACDSTVDQADQAVAASTSASTGGAASSSDGVGGSQGGMGGDHGMPSDTYPAPHPSPPYVANSGGPVLTSPHVYPVFFNNDDPAFTAKIADFVTKVANTQYWAQNTKEYGVGPIVAVPPIQLAEDSPPNWTDADIQAWLAMKLDGTHMEFPTPDSNTLIALFFPSAVSISQGTGGGLSCQTFGGYHNNGSLGGNSVIAYSVIPRCSNFDGFTGIDAVTAAASHELIEAATDPYPNAIPAFAQPDLAHVYWAFALGGGETGDMCAQTLQSFTKFPEMPEYVVQRSWSNKSAKAGHDPCVPSIGPYFNSAPVLNDSIPINLGGQTYKMKGVNIPVGQTKTIEIDLFSDKATSGPWTIHAIDGNQAMGAAPQLSFYFDRNQGVNGEKVYLDITVEKKSQYDSEIFYLFSDLDQDEHVWIGLVGN